MADTGRVALVTGASAGLGRACADRLAAAGWKVTGASRRGTSGVSWTGLSMDVDSDDAVHAGVADMLARAGRIDALIASKRAVAESVVEGGAEAKLTELPNEELMRLVSLDLASALSEES